MQAQRSLDATLAALGGESIARLPSSLRSLSSGFLPGQGGEGPHLPTLLLGAVGAAAIVWIQWRSRARSRGYGLPVQPVGVTAASSAVVVAAVLAFTYVLAQYNGLGYLDEIRESFVQNRRVLAVLSMYRRKVKGSVLGTSKTGSIVFIEPETTLRLSRELGNLEFEEQEEVTIFAVNRHTDEALPMDIYLRSFGAGRIVEHIVLENEDLKATNTEEFPDRVKPHSAGNATWGDNGRIEATLAKASWNVIRIKL